MHSNQAPDDPRISKLLRGMYDQLAGNWRSVASDCGEAEAL
ncbi:hypothetical protein PY650_31215 [Rhizobium calliandrae]|uniref:Uncharacterized protein n=1 Tax=Rhizobium calliandrae TaxID=1312182 RepID=A0ABT7KN03_9HYPH|nr:hypothetical protein [Rhizobium calliandrae]MDL2410010.1 hypothetical protein [Rhizobium calliandrae]